jgi:hypothetical protein
MSSSDWAQWVAITVAFLTAAVGWGFNVWQLKKAAKDRKDQQQREDALLKRHQEREDALRERHREDAPRIELEITCKVLGLKGECFIVEFAFVFNNRGLIEWTFPSIQLRVRGIEKDHPLGYWQGRGQRLYFPVKIIPADSPTDVPKETRASLEEVIPERFESFFVEPGVRQAITYATMISAQVEYIAVYVKFMYKENTTSERIHTSERVFRLTTRDKPDAPVPSVTASNMKPRTQERYSH